MSSRIALAHDYFIQMGGAERVAEAFCGMFPGAPMYTTAALRERLPASMREVAVHTSWMQRLPAIERRNRHYFLLYPFAVESLDLSNYDLIVSSSSGYAKGIRTRRDAVHVCYCHTPMRWAWRYEDYASREGFGRATQTLLPMLLWGLRKWDLRAAGRPDHFVANSHTVAERIKAIYNRDAVVIPPPIDANRFQPGSEQDDYYLALSRLVPYKRIDLAVEACTRLNRRLLVIGDGPDRKRLEAMAGPTVRFLGRQSDQVVERCLSRCRALLFPGEEDFGLTPLEANAAGRPVIAYRAGGATETVVEGRTGVFFNQPTSDSLAGAIEDFERRRWSQTALRRHAEGYDLGVFAARFTEFVKSVAPASCQPELAPQPAPAFPPLAMHARSGFCD
jgi:glycosyltransferase involved in cell wall biosynthesis